MVGELQDEVVLVGAGVARNRNRPDFRTASQVSSSDGNRVRWPTCWPATWSMETPAWMSRRRVFLTRTPVRNVPLARAWSPAPSGPGRRRLTWSRPPRTWTWSLTRLQRLQRAVELEVGPLAGRPPGGRDGAVGEVDERRPQRRARGGRGQAAGRPPPRRSSRGVPQRRERRQRDAGAEPAEEMAAAEARPGVARRSGSSPAVMVGSSIVGSVRTPGRRLGPRRSAVRRLRSIAGASGTGRTR